MGGGSFLRVIALFYKPKQNLANLFRRDCGTQIVGVGRKKVLGFDLVDTDE